MENGQNCDFVGSIEENSKKHACNIHETESLTVDDANFNFYVMHNFEMVFDSYNEADKHIKCYYCAYIS